jgi:hypothetical protein
LRSSSVRSPARALRRGLVWWRREEANMPRIRTHPGEVLREEYLKPLGLSARALAK